MARACPRWAVDTRAAVGTGTTCAVWAGGGSIEQHRISMCDRIREIGADGAWRIGESRLSLTGDAGESNMTWKQ